MMHYLIWLSCLLPLAAAAASPTPAQDLAPTGTLRVAMNFGNPVLAQRDPASGEPRGVASALAHELAKRLGVPLTFVPFDSAGQVTDAIPRNAWDIAFLAVDPVRAAEIEFTAPYVIIEGTYMVRQDSPLQFVGDVDKPGIRISVGLGSAYDLYLTRTIKSATVLRADAGGGSAVIRKFLDDKLDVAAGVRQQLDAYAMDHPEMRVMPGHFQEIRQAMGMPRVEGKPRAAGAAFLADFVEEMKTSGFVAEALKRSGQVAQVPPAGK